MGAGQELTARKEVAEALARLEAEHHRELATLRAQHEQALAEERRKVELAESLVLELQQRLEAETNQLAMMSARVVDTHACRPPEAACKKQKPALKTWPDRYVKVQGKSLLVFDKEDDEKQRGSSIPDVS